MQVGQITDADLGAARRLVAEYLDDEESFDESYRWRPDLVVAARQDGNCVGVCYATPATGAEVVLAGIAVEAARAGRGAGSLLLAAFEETVAAAGFRRVSLGAEPGYVEHFYEKNGYRPVEYMVMVDGPVSPARLAGLRITRVRQRGDRTFLNIASTGGRDEEARSAVLAACGGTEVYTIYAKDLP
jgi:GNAT superfamily N-acetyltransferase